MKDLCINRKRSTEMAVVHFCALCIGKSSRFSQCILVCTSWWDHVSEPGQSVRISGCTSVCSTADHCWSESDRCFVGCCDVNDSAIGKLKHHRVQRRVGCCHCTTEKQVIPRWWTDHLCDIDSFNKPEIWGIYMIVRATDSNSVIQDKYIIA